MPAGQSQSKVEVQRQKTKLANSYSELLEEFASKDLRHVGNYTLGKLIGKGAFGKVYLAKHSLTNGSKVVLKSSKRDDANLAREIHHHRQFIHPHIARLYEVIVTENLVWLVLEYCPGDELYNYVVRTGALPIETVQKIFTQLVGAVAYIHGKSCVHRDLKLENVLLDKHENVKLCDFGFTREYEGSKNYLQTFCGTVAYSAPEMLRGEKYAGEKVDVWSLGIILYALIRGELPFDEDDDHATKAKILKDELNYPDTFPDAAKSLVTKLLSKRPLHRPSLADILMDAFLAEHAPQQQAILKLAQPAPFTTALEKNTLERMRSAGVDIDQVIENVLSQRCDALAGWWTLLIEKEERKEARREKKRREREADMKVLRRLSGASSRLDKMTPVLGSVDEFRRPSSGDRPRSSSRGRTNRRSTPQILVSDLPQLPEGSAIASPRMEAFVPPPPSAEIPPPPIEKDSIRSRSGSRPPLPPKERKRRSSTLQLVINNPDLLGPSNGVTKRRTTKRHNNQFLNQLTAIKSWFVESAKRARSPGKSTSTTSTQKETPPKSKPQPLTTTVPPPPPLSMTNHSRDVSGATLKSNYGATLTPTISGTNPNGYPLHALTTPLDTSSPHQYTHRHRSSLSPSPITPRSSHHHRHATTGLRGRKSTSSSVSSIRSLHRRPTQSHSKASSVSSNSIETLHSPGAVTRRSPHPSVKVLPSTPTNLSFPNNIRVVRSTDGRPLSGTFPDASSAVSGGSGGVMFARRKKSTFKGPKGAGPAMGLSLNPAFFGLGAGMAMGSPALRPQDRGREGSDGKINLGLKDLPRRGSGNKRGRGSQVIEEEEEEDEEDEHNNILGEEDEEDEHNNILGEEDEEEDEEDVEEVEAFSPVDLDPGETLHSIKLWDDPGLNQEENKSPAVAGEGAKDMHHTNRPEDEGTAS